MWTFTAVIVKNKQVIHIGAMEDEHGFRLLTDHDPDVVSGSITIQNMLSKIGCATSNPVDANTTECTFNLSAIHGKGVLSMFTTPNNDIHVTAEQEQLMVAMLQHNINFLEYFKAAPTLESLSSHSKHAQAVKGGRQQEDIKSLKKMAESGSVSLSKPISPDYVIQNKEIPAVVNPQPTALEKLKTVKKPAAETKQTMEKPVETESKKSTVESSPVEPPKQTTVEESTDTDIEQLLNSIGE